MNIEEKNVNFQKQEEVAKILAKYRLSFECPHCRGEITEEHFGKGERVFQLISEKVRVMIENEVDSQRISHGRQLLKEIEQTKKYEEFAGFLKLKLESEKQVKLIDQLKNQIQEQEKKYIVELVEKTGELKEKSQLEKENLKKTIEELEKDISKLQSSEEVEKLGRVKELKEKIDSYQKENEKLKLGKHPETEKLRENIRNLENQLAETKINSEKLLAKATSADTINELKMVKELKEERDKYQKENEELVKRNRDLVISKNKNSQSKGEDFEK